VCVNTSLAHLQKSSVCGGAKYNAKSQRRKVKSDTPAFFTDARELPLAITESIGIIKFAGGNKTGGEAFIFAQLSKQDSTVAREIQDAAVQRFI